MATTFCRPIRLSTAEIAPCVFPPSSSYTSSSGRPSTPPFALIAFNARSYPFFCALPSGASGPVRVVITPIRIGSAPQREGAIKRIDKRRTVQTKSLGGSGFIARIMKNRRNQSQYPFLHTTLPVFSSLFHGLKDLLIRLPDPLGGNSIDLSFRNGKKRILQLFYELECKFHRNFFIARFFRNHRSLQVESVFIAILDGPVPKVQEKASDKKVGADKFKL